jgi:hypothetical protein
VEQPPIVEEEPPAVVVTGARPDVVADAVAGIGGIVTPVEVPPSTVTTEPPFEQPPVAEEEPPVAIVTGARPDAVADAVAGIGGSVISDIGGGVATDVVAGDTRTDTLEEEEEGAPIVVTGPSAPPLSTLDVTNAIGGIIPGLIPGTVPGAGVYDPTENVIINTATPETTAPDVTNGIGGLIPGTIPGAGVYDPTENVIINTATPEATVPEEPGSIPVMPPFTPIRTDLGFTGVRDGVTQPEEDGIGVRDILDVANVATTVLPIVGGIVGGGGGGGGTLPPDTSKITFRPGTLRPRLPGGGIGGVGGAGGRYPYTPTTYGRTGGDQETEYLFFTRDPVAGAAAAPAIIPGKKEGGEIEDDMVKHLVEYHKNGGHHGPGQVKGIGSGQEDKIPAWLSDGEYVWSAQDVADLGDGSTDEGVRRLDKMRQMVRQQAGRKDVKKIAKPQKGIDKMLKAVGGLA